MDFFRSNSIVRDVSFKSRHLSAETEGDFVGAIVPAILRVEELRRDQENRITIQARERKWELSAESFISGLDRSPLSRELVRKIVTTEAHENFNYIFDTKIRKVLVWPKLRAAGDDRDTFERNLIPENVKGRGNVGPGKEIKVIALDQSNPYTAISS